MDFYRLFRCSRRFLRFFQLPWQKSERRVIVGARKTRGESRHGLRHRHRYRLHLRKDGGTRRRRVFRPALGAADGLEQCGHGGEHPRRARSGALFAGSVPLCCDGVRARRRAVCRKERHGDHLPCARRVLSAQAGRSSRDRHRRAGYEGHRRIRRCGAGLSYERQVLRRNGAFSRDHGEPARYAPRGAVCACRARRRRVHQLDLHGVRRK